MSVYFIDPLRDPRWAELVGTHPRASVFHTPEWLEALHRTYGYTPLVLTTSPPGVRLTTGLPICHVRTWFARRLVSLPFSDHCEPLVERDAQLEELLSFLEQGVDAGTWKYAELRPRDARPCGDERSGAFRAGQSYWLHRLDLSGTRDELFGRFHSSCVQRAIRRAQREELVYEKGSTPALVETFYRLLRLTRRRHGLPPQPLAWFRNLSACMGDRLAIHLASRNGRSIAGILTLTFRKTVVYKYGGSDARYHKLGGMPFLFWKAIQEAKDAHMAELDLGRSDPEQAGLIAFKDRLGASRFNLTYRGYPMHAQRTATTDDWKRRLARQVFERLPDPALSVAGKILYRHLG